VVAKIFEPSMPFARIKENLNHNVTSFSSKIKLHQPFLKQLLIT
jgi:hypothetical protein